MYRIIRHLSIDVALGASSMMFFVAQYLNTQISGRYYFLLSLITWLIYTTDHLMDARNIKHDASTPRHRFHQKYYKAILSVAVIGLFVFISLIPRETANELFRLSLALAALVLLYFLSLIWARKTQFRYVLKELFIAICYTLGVCLVPAFQVWPLSAMEFLFIGLVFLLALANLFIFSVREMKPDFQDANPSAIRFLGLSMLKTLVAICLWTHALACLYLVYEGELFYALIFLSMNLILSGIFYLPKRFQQNEHYRLMGDGIFLIPSLCLLVERIFFSY